ncbi:lonely Cys domain-containing protein [Streptomyces sp. NBC_01549]|uniref:lonely Cys domain-containing protein n=1 Tax=Streptomyces sp. NBC_01549 TaxID=2975874 RepID=UPI0022523D4C|nr:lonely Cys domain-containing protein [Streptomyces sp. NBC_01549]MCX4597453.1 lonely Cys domain-containing protein [Streptomyces sp. NBC_01549]
MEFLRKLHQDLEPLFAVPRGAEAFFSPVHEGAPDAAGNAGPWQSAQARMAGERGAEMVEAERGAGRLRRFEERFGQWANERFATGWEPLSGPAAGSGGLEHRIGGGPAPSLSAAGMSHETLGRVYETATRQVGRDLDDGSGLDRLDTEGGLHRYLDELWVSAHTVTEAGRVLREEFARWRDSAGPDERAWLDGGPGPGPTPGPAFFGAGVGVGSTPGSTSTSTSGAGAVGGAGRERLEGGGGGAWSGGEKPPADRVFEAAERAFERMVRREVEPLLTSAAMSAGPRLLAGEITRAVDRLLGGGGRAAGESPAAVPGVRRAVERAVRGLGSRLPRVREVFERAAADERARQAAADHFEVVADRLTYGPRGWARLPDPASSSGGPGWELSAGGRERLRREWLDEADTDRQKIFGDPGGPGGPGGLGGLGGPGGLGGLGVVGSDGGRGRAGAERRWQEVRAARERELPGRLELQSRKEDAAHQVVDAVREAAESGDWRRALNGLGREFRDLFPLGDHAAGVEVRRDAARSLGETLHQALDQWAAAGPAGRESGAADRIIARHLRPEDVGRRVALAAVRRSETDKARAEAVAAAAGDPRAVGDAVDRFVDTHADRVAELFDRHFAAGQASGRIDAVAVAGWRAGRKRLTEGLGHHLAFEFDATHGIGRWAQGTREAADGRHIDDENYDRIAATTRKDWFETYNRLFAGHLGPNGLDTGKWLLHEETNANRFRRDPDAGTPAHPDAPEPPHNAAPLAAVPHRDTDRTAGEPDPARRPDPAAVTVADDVIASVQPGSRVGLAGSPTQNGSRPSSAANIRVPADGGFDPPRMLRSGPEHSFSGRERADGSELVLGLSGVGAGMPGLEVPVRDAGGGEPVSAALVAGPPAALPRLSLVRFDEGETGLSEDRQNDIQGLAWDVAEAGLRNRRAGAPLPDIEITGYGADSGRERVRSVEKRGFRRARAVHELFVDGLDLALGSLQPNVPAGPQRLTSKDFSIAQKNGRAWVPARGASAGSSKVGSPADPSPQATIAVTSPGHAAAVEILDVLRGGDGELGGGRFDVDAVARRVLHLSPHVRVDEETRGELYELVERAAAVGRASGLVTLGVFHLEEEGILAQEDRSQHFTVSGSRMPGLNWTGPAVTELRSTSVADLTHDQRGGFSSAGDPELAPWPLGVTPYVVLAEGRHDTVTARMPDGTMVRLGVDEFVELVARDPALRGRPAQARIVLAVPFAGDRYLELPRKLADATGRIVWAHSGRVQRHPDPGADTTIAVVRQDGQPHGSWIEVAPGLAPDADDSAPGWHREVLSQPIISTLTGRQIGRSLFHPGELAGQREDTYSRLDRMTHFAHYNPVTRTYSAILPLPDLGPTDKAYHLVGHGMPGKLLLPLEDGGTKLADRREAGQWLRRRKSLSSRPSDHFIDLSVCFGGADEDEDAQESTDQSTFTRFAADSLADDALSFARALANITRRRVRASYGMQGTTRSRDHRVLFTDERGRRWWWETSRPEPDEAELDRLAERAWFEGEPSPARRRARTLRLVRALRLHFGHDIEDAADYATLMSGAAAVDNMWHGDADLSPTGPFSLDLLQRVIAAHPQAPAGSDAQVSRWVLAAATDAWQSGSARSVSQFVDLPVLRSAARWLQDTAAVQVAATVLRPSASGGLDTTGRARMFWARVKALETLPTHGPDANAYITKVLHQEPADHVNDELRDDALTLLTRGFALGRDMDEADVAAAYDLEDLGAFDLSDRRTTMGSATGHGRAWDGAADVQPDLGTFRTPGGTVDAPWAGKDAAGRDQLVPYLVRASVNPQFDDHVDVVFGGKAYRVPATEFAELLAADPALGRLTLETPVLLALDGPGKPTPALATSVAQRLGRSVWWGPFPVDLSGTNAAGAPVLTLTDPRATRTTTHWHLTRPTDPAGTNDADTPVPASGAPQAGTTTTPHPDFRGPIARQGSPAPLAFAAPGPSHPLSFQPRRQEVADRGPQVLWRGGLPQGDIPPSVAAGDHPWTLDYPPVEGGRVFGAAFFPQGDWQRLADPHLALRNVTHVEQWPADPLRPGRLRAPAEIKPLPVTVDDGAFVITYQGSLTSRVHALRVPEAALAILLIPVVKASEYEQYDATDTHDAATEIANLFDIPVHYSDGGTNVTREGSYGTAKIQQWPTREGDPPPWRTVMPTGQPREGVSRPAVFAVQPAGHVHDRPHTSVNSGDVTAGRGRPVLEAGPVAGPSRSGPEASHGGLSSDENGTLRTATPQRGDGHPAPLWHEGVPTDDPRVAEAVERIGRLSGEHRDALLAEAGGLMGAPLVAGREPAQEELRRAYRAALVEVADALLPESGVADVLRTEGTDRALEIAKERGFPKLSESRGGGKRRKAASGAGEGAGGASTAQQGVGRIAAPTEVFAQPGPQVKAELARVAGEFTPGAGNVARMGLAQRLQDAVLLSGWYEGWPVRQVASLLHADRQWMNKQEDRESLAWMLRPEHVHVLKALAHTKVVGALRGRPQLVTALAASDSFLEQMENISERGAREIIDHPEYLDPLVKMDATARDDLFKDWTWAALVLRYPELTYAFGGRADLLKHVLHSTLLAESASKSSAFLQALVDRSDPLLMEELSYEIPLTLAILETVEVEGLTAGLYRDVLENKPLRESLRRHGNLALALFRVPALLKAALADTWVVDGLARSPMLGQVIWENPGFAERIARSRELFEAATENPGVAEFLSRDPRHFDRLKNDAELLLALRQASPGDRSAAVSRGVPVADPALEIILAQPEWAAAADADPEMKRVLRLTPNLLSAPHEYRQLLRETHLHPDIREGSILLAPGLLRAAVTHPWLAPCLSLEAGSSEAHLTGELSRFLRRLPMLGDLIYRSPSAVFAAWASPALRAKLSRLNLMVEQIGDDDRLPAGFLAFNSVSENVKSMNADVYGLLMADEAALLRLLRRNDSAASAFSEKVFGSLGSDESKSMLRALADLPEILMTSAHWEMLFGNRELLSALGSPEHAAARDLLLSKPAVFAEAIARPGFTDALERDSFREELAKLVERKRRGKGYVTALEAAVKATGAAVLSPEGVPFNETDRALAGVFDTASLADAEALVRERVSGPETDRLLNAVRDVWQDEMLLRVARKSSGVAALLLRSSELGPTLRARPLLEKSLTETSSSLLSLLGQSETMLRALRSNDGFYTLLMSGSLTPYLADPSEMQVYLDNPYWGLVFMRAELPSSVCGSVIQSTTLFGLVQGSKVLSKAALDESPVIEILHSHRDLAVTLAALPPGAASDVLLAAVAGSPTLAQALARDPGRLTAALKRVPGLADHLATHGDFSEDPEHYVNILTNDVLLDKLVAYPGQVATLFSGKTSEPAVTAARVPDLVAALHKDPALAGVLRRDPQVRELVRQQPEIALDLANADPGGLAGPHGLRVALGSVQGLAEAMIQDPQLGKDLRHSPHALPALMRNRALLTPTQPGDVMLWHAVVHNPVLAQALTPRTLHGLRRHPELVKVLAAYGDDLSPAGMDAASLAGLLADSGLCHVLNSSQELAGRFLTTPDWYRRALRDPGFVPALQALAAKDRETLLAAVDDPSGQRLLRATDAQAAGPATPQPPRPAATAARGPAGARTRRPAQPGKTATATATVAATRNTATEATPRTVSEPALAGTARRSPLAEALERAPEVMELIEGGQGAAVMQGLARHPQLLPLVVSAPALVEELTQDPGRLTSYRFDSSEAGLDKFDKDFQDYLDSLGVILEGAARKLVRDSTYPAWSQAVAERDAQAQHTQRERVRRLTAFRVNDPRTWEHSGRIVHADRLRRDVFTQAQSDTLADLAAGRTAPREGRAAVQAHIALHAHLDSGSNGVSFTYVLADDGLVDLLAYAISTHRNGNSYRWEGAGGHPVKGPLDIGVVSNDPAMTASKRLATTPPPPEPAPTRTPGHARTTPQDTTAQDLVTALTRYRDGITALQHAQNINDTNARNRATQTAERSITLAVQALHELGLTPRTPQDRTRSAQTNAILLMSDRGAPASTAFRGPARIPVWELLDSQGRHAGFSFAEDRLHTPPSAPHSVKGILYLAQVPGPDGRTQWRKTEGDSLELPDSFHAARFEIVRIHGQRTFARLSDGTRVFADELFARLSEEPAFRALPEGCSILLETCRAAVDDDPAHPSGEENLALGLANAFKGDVWASTTLMGSDEDPEFPFHMAKTDSNGLVGDFTRTRPDPTPDELDYIARSVGIHQDPGPVPSERRSHALGLVRLGRRIIPEDDADTFVGTLRAIEVTPVLRPLTGELILDLGGVDEMIGTAYGLAPTAVITPEFRREMIRVMAENYIRADYPEPPLARPSNGTRAVSRIVDAQFNGEPAPRTTPGRAAPGTSSREDAAWIALNVSRLSKLVPAGGADVVREVLKLDADNEVTAAERETVWNAMLDARRAGRADTALSSIQTLRDEYLLTRRAAALPPGQGGRASLPAVQPLPALTVESGLGSTGRPPRTFPVPPRPETRPLREPEGPLP